MNRRNFFTFSSSNTNDKKVPKPMEVSTGLEPYSAPLTIRSAGHALRRMTFGVSYPTLQSVVGKTAAELFDQIAMPMQTDAVPAWANNIPTNPADFQLFQQQRTELQVWLCNQMRKTTLSMQEKMVFFLSHIYTSDTQKIRYAQFMLNNNQKLRSACFGNLKSLAIEMCKDSAMLIFLDGTANRVGRPNENFAREFFELFTLGVGNYTETDILEASRAFTGWQINPTSLDARFVPNRFDNQPKTIFGQTGNWGVDDVVRITFEQQACAEFYVRKLYRFFVYEIITDFAEENVIKPLAQLLRDSNYEIKPVLRKLFTSQHFFDNEFHGSEIKSPANFFIGFTNETGATNYPTNVVVLGMAIQAQELLNPPTVQGWVGYRSWINTVTLPQRQQVCNLFLVNRTYLNTPLNPAYNWVNFAKQFPDNNDANKLVKNIVDYLVSFDVAQSQIDALVDEMLAGLPAIYWDINGATAPTQLQLLMKAIYNLPEYQLN